MLSEHIRKLEIIAEDTRTYDFGAAYPAHFLYLDGAGVPPVKRIQQRIPAQHGTSDQGYRIDERKLTLALYMEARQADEAAVAALYDKLAYIFSPTETALKLRVTRLDGAVRQSDCYVDGLFDFPQSDRLGGSVKLLIPLYAPEPSFYNPTQRTQMASINAASTTVNLDVSGTTYADFPIIDVTGPASSLRIAATYANIDLRLQTAIPSGETFRFDLRRGYKTVQRTSDGANRMSYVNPTYLDALDLLRILGAKELSNYKILAGGSATNLMDFTITCSGTNASSQIAFYWYDRYLSL